MKIAFAILAHQHPLIVERLIRTLISAGHVAAVHFDANSRRADYELLAKHFEGNESVRVARRFRVAWGEWSIPEATLCCLEQIADAGWEPDYVYLMSGSDYPIRSVAELDGFLTRNRGKEFIECVPSNRRRWVRGGPQQERYHYRHHFNWRGHPNLFELSLRLQKALKLRRSFVRGLEPHMGSQWWTLTWDTLKRILELAREPDIVRFFRTTLIPDELFFQTLVAYLVPGRRIVGRTLTLYQFSDYGVPVVYYADHLDYLLSEPFFMARKMSPNNPALFDRLDACWRGEIAAVAFPDFEFGTVGTEYERRRLAYRDGPPGLPIAGHAPDRWSADLGRSRRPFFVVLGTSTVELAAIFRALSTHPGILLHGQIFHPTCIEFAGGATLFAGYRADEVALRDISAPNFVSDIVRTEPRRLSGFLLRWGQGWHMHEVMLDRPLVQVAIVTGDLLLSFMESLLPSFPLLDEPFDLASALAFPPHRLAERLERFIEQFPAHNQNIRKLADKSLATKVPGQLIDIDLGFYSGLLQSSLIRKLESWLEIEPDLANRPVVLDALAREFERMEMLRAAALTQLASIGIPQSALDALRFPNRLPSDGVPTKGTFRDKDLDNAFEPGRLLEMRRRQASIHPNQQRGLRPPEQKAQQEQHESEIEQT